MAGELPGLERGLPVLPAHERVWGIDADTKRVSVAGLRAAIFAGDLSSRLDWRTRSLPQSGPAHIRQSRSLEGLLVLVHGLKQDWGVPTRVLIEDPFAASAQALTAQQRAMGVLLAALGLELGLGVDVRFAPPQTWKLAATGVGRGNFEGSKEERRRQEKARLMGWARTVGYTGDLQDEADACGVAVAAAVMLERRSTNKEGAP